jgi:hypothetical protein
MHPNGSPTPHGGPALDDSVREVSLMRGRDW